MESQLPKPALQLAMVQTLLAHPAVALAKVQTLLQVPQLAGFVRRSVSQPSFSMPLQLSKPVAQAMPHRPEVQLAVPLMPTHTRPQAPQLELSVDSERQIPAQGVWSDGQTRTPSSIGAVGTSINASVSATSLPVSSTTTSGRSPIATSASPASGRSPIATSASPASMRAPVSGRSSLAPPSITSARTVASAPTDVPGPLYAPTVACALVAATHLPVVGSQR